MTRPLDGIRVLELTTAVAGPIAGCVFAERCPHVEDRCLTERPEPTRLGPDHWSSCHLASERAARETPAGKPWETP